MMQNFKNIIRVNLKRFYKVKKFTDPQTQTHWHIVVHIHTYIHTHMTINLLTYKRILIILILILNQITFEHIKRNLIAEKNQKRTNKPEDALVTFLPILILYTNNMNQERNRLISRNSC